ncbi:MAG: hypothetical protein PHS92_04190 [Candidatus Gracilibacteria bacterium]|nr:hypothetical protein [Candidatus Gracilibacteria bacterium]
MAEQTKKDSIQSLKDVVSKVDINKNDKIELKELKESSSALTNDFIANLKDVKKFIEDKKKTGESVPKDVLDYISGMVGQLNTIKDEYDSDKKLVCDNSQACLDNLKEVFATSKEVGKALTGLKEQITELQEKETVKKFAVYLGVDEDDIKRLNLSTALLAVSKAPESSFEAWETAGYKNKGGYFGGLELGQLDNLKSLYVKDVSFKKKVDEYISNPRIIEGVLESVSFEGKTFKVGEEVDYFDHSKEKKKLKITKIFDFKGRYGIEGTIIPGNSKVMVDIDSIKKAESSADKSQTKSESEKIPAEIELNEIFGSYLHLENKDFDEINLSSFIKNIDNIKGNEIEKWIDKGYESKNTWGLRSAEQEQIIKLSKKYNEDPEFKKKIARIKKGPINNFMESVKAEGFRVRLSDSKYEADKLNVTNPEFIINFMSDRDADGKVETLNKFERKWYLAFIGGDMVQGQHISETFMKDSLSNKFKTVQDFNVLLKRLGVKEIKPETTRDELLKIKESFYGKLVEKMTKMGKNGNLDGYYAILDGTEKDFMKNELTYEEKLENDIDKLLNDKQNEEIIKKRLGELKEKYGLPKAENEGDLQRIKDLIKGTLIQSSEMNFGLFGGAINVHGDTPKGGDIIGQIINGLDMKNYKGILGFYVSKRVYQNQDKTASVNVGIANFIPYVSANYAMTAKDMNKEKIGTAEKVDGNLTVVPGVSLSLVSVGAHVELNWNDKNKAIEREIVKTRDLLKNIKIDPKTNNLIIDRDNVKKQFNEKGDEKISKQIDVFFKSFEEYFNEFKTGNPKLDQRLLQKLQNSTVTYFTNELYAKNEGWNISGLTVGVILSLFNFGTWASFLGLNIQFRNQEFKDSNDSASQDQIESASINAKEPTEADFKKAGFEKTVLKKGEKEYTVFRYTGPIKNFYASKDIQIEESKDGKEIYISGDIKKIFFAEKDSNNRSSESYFLINGAKYGDVSYGKEINRDIAMPTRTSEVEVSGSSYNFESKIDNFNDRELIKKLSDKIENSDRYKSSFLKFQNLLSEMYISGDAESPWKQFGAFLKELPKSKSKDIIAYCNSVNPDDMEKKKQVMMSMLGDTAGDWRLRFMNELKKDTPWAKKERRKLGLKKNFRVDQIRDGKDDVIDHVKKAEIANMRKFIPNFDLGDYKRAQDDYDSSNDVKNQSEGKVTKTVENAIVFVNFTQKVPTKGGKSRKGFHSVVPIYGNVELHAGSEKSMDNSGNKLEYVDKIPNRVLISKFDQIKAQIKADPQNNKNYKDLVEKMDNIKDDNQKIKVMNDALKGKNNDIGLKGTFNLSFVRWSTCQNSAIMINNMKFSLDIPGYKSSEIIPGLPVFGKGSFYKPAKEKNNADQLTVGGTLIEGNFNKKASGAESQTGGGDGPIDIDGNQNDE